jgi:proline iminopeptidase
VPVAKIDSTSLYFEAVGTGAPCLIAHGGPGLNHGPYRSLDALATVRQLVYWDHRGHGRSASLPAGALGMETFADDAARLADHLELDTFAVFGHSFGGWVAQELALRHPDRVSALILAATTPGQLGSSESPGDDQGPPPPLEVVELMGRRPSNNIELADLYRALAPHFTRTADPAPLLNELDPAMLSVDGFRRVFDEALARWSAVDRLASIACPTLVLGGRHDVFCSPAQLTRIARRIPDAEQLWLENSGHFVWLEEPEPFFRVVSQWLCTH